MLGEILFPKAEYEMKDRPSVWEEFYFLVKLGTQGERNIDIKKKYMVIFMLYQLSLSSPTNKITKLSTAKKNRFFLITKGQPLKIK